MEQNPQQNKQKQETPAEKPKPEKVSEPKEQDEGLNFDMNIRPAEVEDLFPGGFGNFDIGL